MISLSLKHDALLHSRRDSSKASHVAQSDTDIGPRAFDEFDGIPNLYPSQSAKVAEPSVFDVDPYGIAAEQFRLMQRRLSNLRPTGGTALLTSPGAGDGKSLNAHSLAWALAEAGHSTLLLELDLRRPALSRYLPGKPSKGVTDVLSGQEDAHSAVRRIHDLPLFYLGLDKPASRPSRLLRSRRMDDLMQWATRTFTWVIVDGPPVLAVSDVEELLPRVELVLMVVRERGTPRAMLDRASDHLGGRLNFVIYNDVYLSDEYGYQ